MEKMAVEIFATIPCTILKGIKLIKNAMLSIPPKSTAEGITTNPLMRDWTQPTPSTKEDASTNANVIHCTKAIAIEKITPITVNAALGL